MTKENLIIGIDASRNRSGGAINYLIGILNHLQPINHGISEIHVWTPLEVANQLPNKNWLKVHSPDTLQEKIYWQVMWQVFTLPKELKFYKCDILFTSDASSMCTFKPSVVFSQDLLAYEEGMIKSYGFSLKTIRLILILFMQNFSFRRAQGVIFLTEYAARIIQNKCGSISNKITIPHGVDDEFKNNISLIKWPNKNKEIICLYISPIDNYKNHLELIEAVITLNQEYKLKLVLVGDGDKKIIDKINNRVSKANHSREIVVLTGAVSRKKIKEYMKNSNIFVFSSSCEAFGISLLEAMAIGLPIASSNKSSIPETLRNGGVYYDPKDVNDIVKSLKSIIQNSGLRNSIALNAKTISDQYSWTECSNKTFNFIAKTQRNYLNK